MPVAYKAGTFEPAPNFRWVKMFKGVRHRITCEELGLPRDRWTKEGSREAANKWWEAKLSELTANPVNAAFQRIILSIPQPAQAIGAGQLARKVAALGPIPAEAPPELIDEFIGLGSLDEENPNHAITAGDERRLFYLNQMAPPSKKPWRRSSNNSWHWLGRRLRLP